MSGKGASVVVLGVVLFALVSYAGCRVIRHYVFPQSGNGLPVFVSTCHGNTIPSGLTAHPIVTFGDSLTEGYGATYKCLPRELRSTVPEGAHLVHATDTSYPGDLARLLRLSTSAISCTSRWVRSAGVSLKHQHPPHQHPGSAG